MTAQRLRREFLGADQAPQARDEAELRELLDVLGGETQRINRIVQQFLDYARPPRFSLRQASLREMLDGAAGALSKAATRRVTISSAISTGAGDAVFDPGSSPSRPSTTCSATPSSASPYGGRVRLEARRDRPHHVIDVVYERSRPAFR